MTTKLDKIKKSPLFKGLSDDELLRAKELLSAVRTTYLKGEYLLSAAEPFLRFGLVLSGAVSVYMDDIDGERMIMATAHAGDTFGESHAYLGTSESPVYILAAEEAEILWLSPASLYGYEGDALALRLRERFTALLATRALYQNARIQILSKPTIRARIVAFLTQHEARAKSKTFSVPFDRNTLAVYLGVNRSALSRELSAMKREGLIDFYKNTFKLR